MDFVKKKAVRYTFVLITLFLSLIAAFIVNIGMGSVEISAGEVVGEIINKIRGHDPSNAVYSSIIWKIRLPRTLAAIIGGASLAVAGLLLQIFFRNPLVGPFVLGISSGASLVVALVLLGGITFGFGLVTPLLLFLAAFVGAVAVMFLVLGLARKVESVVTLLIIGLMVGFIASAVTSLLIAFAESEAVRGFVIWTMGSFTGFTWRELNTLAMVGLPMLFFSLIISKPLNALLLGEKYAISMGVNIKRIRILVVLTTSILAALVTAFTGPIAFIGLAVPHLSRLSFGTSDNKILLPGTVLLGATVTVICDLIARTVFAPVEIPLSAVTSIIGAPVVIILLLRRRNVL